MNAAAAALLAMAPPAPRVVNEKGGPLIGRQPSGTTPIFGGRRHRAPWDIASIVVTHGPLWEAPQSVGKVTQFVVPGASIDDWVFGVAAVGAGGHKSLISAYVAAPRVVDDVKLAK